MVRRDPLHRAALTQPLLPNREQMEWAIRDISEKLRHAVYCMDRRCKQCNSMKELIETGITPITPQTEGQFTAAGTREAATTEPAK